MDLVCSETSSRIISEYWYKYKADHYSKLYRKHIYPYSKPLPLHIVNLHVVSIQVVKIKSFFYLKDLPGEYIY